MLKYISQKQYISLCMIENRLYFMGDMKYFKYLKTCILEIKAIFYYLF